MQQSAHARRMEEGTRILARSTDCALERVDRGLAGNLSMATTKKPVDRDDEEDVWDVWPYPFF